MIDTQPLILAGRAALPKTATEIFASPTNEIYFSLASLWEIGIKAALGKLRFKRSITNYHQMLVEELGLMALPIEPLHIEKAVSLPFHHKDPFDRLIIGQAIVEKLTILSGDSRFDLYECKRVWE